ncbi:MAG: hypothetical protein GF331_17830 [Chitinivibrionales bacterium]|nr:hypothetical protein [Chitinivibrionales bacterium]
MDMVNENRDAVSARVDSRFVVLLPGGNTVELEPNVPPDCGRLSEKIGDSLLAGWICSQIEQAERRPAPPSLAAMRKLELADYEPASDSGNLRMYPRGKLMFDLLCDWAEEIAVNRFGAMPIHTPLLYNWEDSQIRQQAGSFHENHYVVKRPDDPASELILRFAGDFGLFKIMHDAVFSYRMLPLRIYELSQSFRYERRGALAGLRRLRAFHLPDIHCFCADPEQAWEEYCRLYEAYEDLAVGAGVDYAVCFRMVESFFETHRDRVAALLRRRGRPALVEVLSEMRHYWAIKHEFQSIDSVGGAVQLSTVQLDVKEAGVYDIGYTAADGSRAPCVICHSSVGSIERWIYAVLEQALKSSRPALPLWLAPTQVRLLPVSHKQLEYCLEVEMDGVRCDVDDSDETIGKKVARAGKEWVPYVAVVGEREMAQGTLAVTDRYSGRRRQMSPDELAAEMRAACSGMPFRRLTLPRRLSMRARFA